MMSKSTRTRTTSLAACAATVLGVLSAAAPAPAAIVEIGQTSAPATPSCPTTPCFAVPRTTGYQAKVGEQRALYTVPQDGRIVAWSITLSTPNDKQIADFEERFGGAAAAGVTVMRPGRKLYGRTVAVSPTRRLRDYFGGTVQFPLERSIAVRKGWIVALNVPTWAPALAVGFGNDHSWRAASRSRGDCNDLSTQVPQRTNQIARYRCLFRTARLTYTATLVTSPPERSSRRAR